MRPIMPEAGVTGGVIRRYVPYAARTTGQIPASHAKGSAVCRAICRNGG